MNKPSFYSILPAKVRYDKELKDKAKLIYSEITSLSNSDGECYALNEYFCNLYDISEATITRIIRQLKKKKLIEIEYIYKEGSKEILKRVIKIPQTFYDEGVSKMTPRGVKNDGDNNIKKYNIPKGILYKEKINPTLEEIKEYANKRDLKHVDCEYFYNYFNDNNWIDSKGRKVRSWKQKMLTWEKHEKEKKMKYGDEDAKYTRV